MKAVISPVATAATAAHPQQQQLISSNSSSPAATGSSPTAVSSIAAHHGGPYQKKLLTALAFLRGPSPKLGPNLWALTGGTRLIPPNFLGVVRRLFRGGAPKKSAGRKIP